ncbi:MAG: hypothetical protein ABJM43_20425 [Paracoccaceae bacterium]
MALSEDVANILADQVGYLVENYFVAKEVSKEKLPASIKLGFSTANSLIRDGKNEEAESLILKLVKDEPKYVRGRLRLIHAYNESGNPVMALSNSQYALAQATTPRTKSQLLGLSGQAVFAMFKKYQDQSLLQPCEAFYKNAIRVYPSDPFARWNIVGVLKDAYGIENERIQAQLTGLCDQCLEDGHKYKALYDRLLDDWDNVLGDEFQDQKCALSNALLSSSALKGDQSEASRLSRRALVAAGLAAGVVALYQSGLDSDTVEHTIDFFRGIETENIDINSVSNGLSETTKEVELNYSLDDLKLAEVKYDLGDLA